MRAGSRPWSPIATTACIALLMLSAAACTAGSQTAPDPMPSAAPPASKVTAARAALGDPMVALAESLLQLSDAVDTVRHETPRGGELVANVDAVLPLVTALETATANADRAARDMGLTDDRVGRAATVVADTAEVAARAGADASAELAALRQLAELDVAMEAVVATWDAPGSQSARRSALAEAGAQADALAEQARAEPALPADCPALRDHRVTWAGTVAERSRALSALATGSSGAEHDAQLATFDAEPYGEDRLAADAADRPCWRQSSVLAQSADGVRGQVAALESLLR